MAKRRRVQSGEARAQIRDLRRVFYETHQHGLRALEERDLKAFGEAIDVERRLIAELHAMIEEQRVRIRRRREALDRTIGTTKARNPRPKKARRR